ncbi:alpha/beta fold hydrolase [Sphingomonas sp. 28-63-12]|uniref:alpha/beta fold hydrolase n=1 Tax=Sphingomonas sp. 28-63-12 TaxID=1970434 RepID=UPI000BCB3211|nr:MAG: alpha/beta hydrolase [Sphingomonas sp. 28-63-12]
MDNATVRFDGDGLSLCADAFGDPDAPPVLFFHGGGQSRRAWRGSARRVAAAGYYGLTFDLRGHGDSDWAGDGDYDVRAYGRDVTGLLDAFTRPVVLVGASRGGQASLIGASQCPAAVSMIMLADVVPRLRDDGVDDVRRFFARSVRGFATLREAADALATLNHQGPADPAGLARAMRQDAAGNYFWRWDPRTVDPRFLNPPSEAEAVAAAAALVRCPVILVRAELSNVVTDEGVTDFQSITPQLQVIEAKGVGHMFTGDRNDAFADMLLSYLPVPA